MTAEMAPKVTNAVGALTIVLLVGMVLVRVQILKRRGIAAAKFGVIDKTDFFIPPFVFFYFYLIVAAALHWPTLAHSKLFTSMSVAWLGVAFCACAVVIMAITLLAFGKSFRIGIDTSHPGSLVTSGIFAYTRNPIYVGFALALLGEFFILPHWIMLLYAIGGFALFHRQVLREEEYLRAQYGEEYEAYCRRVRRYL